MNWSVQLLLRSLPSASLSVLAYHRVLPAPDPMLQGVPSVEEFERRMRWVASNFDVMPLGEAVRALRADRLPKRALSITFDDGYADNHDLALPVLRQIGLPATFFIATGFLDGGYMFNDVVIEALRQAQGPHFDLSDLGYGRLPVATENERRQAAAAILQQLKYEMPRRRHAVAIEIATRAKAVVPSRLMMTNKEVKALYDAGMEIGAHTVTHPILARMSLDRVRQELTDGRQQLEQITGAPVRLFAYPNGRPGRDYRREHAALARDLGFEAAVTTAWGAARPGDDFYQIPRFTPWDRPNWRFGLRLVRNCLRKPALA
ncbi:MAG TPA: polysaccharide deacetylase family protein [Burkholderiales bacterium]|nr:polysaccharide deacetylase family protein [Burkholderiales bacterium]